MKLNGKHFKIDPQFIDKDRIDSIYTTSWIARVTAASGLVQKFRIVLQPKVKIKNNTSSVYSSLYGSRIKKEILVQKQRKCGIRELYDKVFRWFRHLWNSKTNGAYLKSFKQTWWKKKNWRRKIESPLSLDRKQGKYLRLVF